MRILVILISLFILGVNAQNSQEFNGFIVGTHLGVSYDVLYARKDINDYSPDMKTKGLSSLGYVSQYSLERKYLDKFQYGIKLNFGTIKGENDIETYKGSFSEFSFTGRYSFFERPSLFKAYFSSSLGMASFRANRTLSFDGGSLPLNIEKGSSLKWDCSLGLERHLSSNILCYAEAVFNEIRHDGFDGWDYGTGVDKYNLYAIGFKFLLKK